MRLWVVEMRVKHSGRWLHWLPASTWMYWERGQAWGVARQMRSVAPTWRQHRVKPWVREK